MAEKWANCFSNLFPTTNVAGKHAVVIVPLEGHVIDADLHRENLAGLRAMASFDDKGLLFSNCLPVGPPPLSGNHGVDFEYGHCVEFLLGILQDFTCLLIGEDYLPLGIDPKDAVCRLLDAEGGSPLYLLLSLAVGNVLYDFNKPFKTADL